MKKLSSRGQTYSVIALVMLLVCLGGIFLSRKITYWGLELFHMPHNLLEGGRVVVSFIALGVAIVFILIAIIKEKKDPISEEEDASYEKEE